MARGRGEVEFHGCLGLNYVPITDWSLVVNPVLLELHELRLQSRVSHIGLPISG